MGEVLLDSENLFFGFGWAPGATEQEQRRAFLSRFGAPPATHEEWDVLGVEDLARSAVHALADWARRHLARSGASVQRAVSYGKRDRGVRAVLLALAVEGYRHEDVAWGKNVAEDAILKRLDDDHWARGPYVVGSSDGSVPERVCAAMTANPQLQAVLVMRPDLYVRRRWAWFHSTKPGAEARFPQLGRYGEGHVALHRITDEYLAAQSADRTRRAAPSRPVTDEAAAPVPTPDQRWNLWSRHLAPKPTPERPLTSTAWVRACRGRGIPAAVFRPLRDAVTELYGGAFETGDGPVSWGLACRAAASVPLVQAHPAGPPDELGGTRLAAYQEAWIRLMSRPCEGVAES